QQMAQIDGVLLPQGTVEIVGLVEVLQDLGVDRALEVERAAWREPDQEEGDRDDDEQGRDSPEQSSEDVTEHLCDCPLPPVAKAPAAGALSSLRSMRGRSTPPRGRRGLSPARRGRCGEPLYS